MCTLRFNLVASTRLALIVGVALTSSACEIEPAEFRDGVQLSTLEFELFSENVGVHPFNDVLADPNNPFRRSGVGGDTKFEILGNSSTPGAFYAWASLLATQPTGEHQFYTAELMEAIAATRAGEERFQLEQIAIRGYQAVLDYFPGDVSFTDETLLVKFRVATPAYFGILRLGGQVQGDWVVVIDANGIEEVVEGSSPIRPDPEEEPEEQPEEDDGEG